MRKIIVSMNVTLDGYMAGPSCELDWHFERWTPEMAESLCEQLSQADTILLGRTTYSAMAAYWPQKAADLLFPREDLAFAEMMNRYHKVVFSKTLVNLPWNNSTLVKSNTRHELQKLKRQPGKDMIIYGSGKLIASLYASGLIDQYILWVHPVILGNGKSLFKKTPGSFNMQLLESRVFGSGVVMLRYTSTKL